MTLVYGNDNFNIGVITSQNKDRENEQANFI